MTTTSKHRVTTLAGLLTLASALPAFAAGNDYPTSDRVIYVQECMKTYPGHYYEMVSKCSCAIDAIAAQVPYDDYVHMTTVVNAMTIGGERGGTLRDNDSIKPEVKRYRELQARVQKACFLDIHGPDAK